MLGAICRLQFDVILYPKCNDMADTPWYATCSLLGYANSSIGSTCIHPSPPMMECLYLLSSSIHNLGMSHHQSYLITVPQRMLAKFSAEFARSVDDRDSLDMLQVLYDLSFLRHLTSKWKNAEVPALGHAIDRLQSHVCISYLPLCGMVR